MAVLTVLFPPVITVQPQSLTNTAGTTARFSAAATGSAPLGYQWRLNGVGLANGGRISGVKTNNLSVINVQVTDAGSYTLVVNNAVGVVTSAVATLTVSGPPVITLQPASQSVAAGNNVTFTATAAGTPPLSYQWRFNNANLSGATSTNLTLTSVQPGKAGNYTVVAANSLGSATSAVAVLTVLPSAGTVIIDGAQTYQTIDGFGVNANSGSWNNNDLQPVLDALIDQAGMTLFLAMFAGDCSWETSNANPGPSLTNWTYFNSVYSGPSFQQLWGMMAYLNQRGITYGLMPKFTGYTASWMGGRSLTPGYENDYAKMLASALIYARQTQNLQFTVVPPLNEPDITGFDTGVQLSGASQYVTVVDDLGFQLDDNGMSDVLFSGPELASTSTSWMATMLGDPYLMSKLALFGLHSYAGNTPDASGVYSFIQQSAYPDTHFWMTEFNVWCQSCLNGVSGDNSWAFARGAATYLLKLLAEGASAGIVFEAYDSQFYAYNAATGQNEPVSWSYWGLLAVDDINATHRTYTPRKGFYTLAQIAKFVRPGAQRINVGGASTPLTVLAFYNTSNGQLTLTGANTTSGALTLSCSLSSLPAIPSLDLYYTSSTTNLCYGGSVGVNNGAFALLVPADCVFTLTYTNPVATAAPPTIALAPASQILQAGAMAVLSVEATGTEPLSYQWYRDTTNQLSDGAEVVGSTSDLLTLFNVLGADAGAYTVVVSSLAGVVTSTPPAVLTVIDPVITAQPVSRTNHAGSDAVFSVQAYGTAPEYHWYKNGQPVSGGTQAGLALAGVSDGDAGTYSVIVSNAYGSVTSSAELTVVSPLMLENITLTQNGAAITWNAVPGQNYLLQYKDSLDETGWTSVLPAMTAIAPNILTTNLLSNPTQRFYRIVLVP